MEKSAVRKESRMYPVWPLLPAIGLMIEAATLPLAPNGRVRSVMSVLGVLLFPAMIGLSRPMFAQRIGNDGGHDKKNSIHGVVELEGQQGKPVVLEGITVRLSGEILSSGSLSTLTDSEGRFQFDQLAPGSYRLGIRIKGFKPFHKTIVLGQGELRVEEVRLELEKVVQKIAVRGSATTISQQSSSPPALITRRQITSLPVPPERFQNLLPLVPGVIRTYDGKLNFKGEAENQGLLLMDGIETVDPITGSFAINIPVDAIQTLNVDKAPADAEYGGFSGGLTRLQTKTPEDNWNYSLHDFLPGIRGRSGHIVGIADEIPRIVVGGPLLKNKLNFSEFFQYEVNKVPVRGLAWPHNETKTQGFDSLTVFQAILSPRHVLDVKVNAFPLRRQYANITALIPQSASSDYGQKGFSVSGNDNYQFSSGALLTTLFQFTRFNSNAHGEGAADMLITPGGWRGNFFNTWGRDGDEEQALSVFHFPQKQWHGRHDFKLGFDFSRRAYTGTSRSRPVQLLREDGSLAGQVDFSGGGLLRGKDTDVAEFVQDHWSVGERLGIDLGLRLTTQSRGRSAAPALRAGLVYSLGSDGKTVIRTGGGLFYDRVPLLATDFSENQARTLSLFGANGFPTGQPVVFANAYLTIEGGQLRALRTNDPGTSPRNFSWNVELDREINSHLAFRLRYLYSRTEDEFVVDPSQDLLSGQSFLAFTSTGGTHYHEFETSLKYHPSEKYDFNISYVNSHARGDLNTLTNIFVPFEAPVIRPNAVADLNSDIPNRLVAWGIFRLPLWGLTISPVVDVHSGFPYSNVDVLQNYVGEPNSQRFPTFASFDWKAYRVFHLRVPFLHKGLGKFRLGVYYTNFTDHSNPLEVFNNVTSPNFSQFVGFQHRVAGFVLDTID